MVIINKANCFLKPCFSKYLYVSKYINSKIYVCLRIRIQKKEGKVGQVEQGTYKDLENIFDGDALYFLCTLHVKY